jgi:2-methylcitrate dehydratase PrpD
MNALSIELGEWVQALRYEDLPSDVVDSTRLRVLDVIGLALAGLDTEFGRSVTDAARSLYSPGPCHVLGTGEPYGVTGAPFVNAALSQALEYDDTHVESIVHMSSPSVAAALALSEWMAVDGKTMITAIAVGNEISCRVGSVASGQFHKRGLHPTGLFAPFGIAYLTGKALGSEASGMASAAGIVGSFASGLLECWVDGTQSKFLHSGWAAQSGISAALLARSGVAGPPRILEGRFGLFASFLQDGDAPRDLGRVLDGLGEEWESRKASFKPFPAAHVIHPYISAALRAREKHGIDPARISGIRCPVAAYIVPIVCEPVAEKRAPETGTHGRVCLQYTLAEVLYFGELGRRAYRDDSVRNPAILDLAARVHYDVDPDYPGPGRFKGAVEIEMADGTVIAEVEEYNRGSIENPMSDGELRAKFRENVGARLDGEAADALSDAILGVDQMEDVSRLVSMTWQEN